MKTNMAKAASILLSIMLIVAMIPISSSAESTVVSYQLTGNKGAVITMQDNVRSLQVSNAKLASAEFTGNTVIVTAKEGAVGTITVTVNGIDFEVPLGYTTFILDNDRVTVYEGKDTNYEVYGILSNDANEHTLNKTQSTDGTITYTKSDDGAVANINIKKAGGIYVFGGNSENMSITVNKAAESNAYILLAGLDLKSAITAPITVKKESTSKVYIKALAGTTSTLSDTAFNNADTYGSTEDGGDGTNAEYAESAVIKGKSNSSIILTGKGTLNVNCESKNAVKVGEYGTLTVEKLTLNVQSAKNGLSCDNELIIESGTLDISANGGDAVRSDPDAVNADAGCKGCITINGGDITICASSDGIQAAQDINIYGGNFIIKTGSGYDDKTFNKDTMSCKGIKASFNADTDSNTETTENTTESTNTINIYGGTFNMNTADDAVHSDGYINILGGMFDIYTGDDGVHADTSLTLGEQGGDDGVIVINVISSYEGLEAGNIYIYSGTYNVTASDDGINAAGGNSGNDNFNPGGGPGGGNFGHGGNRPRPGDNNGGFNPGNGGNGNADYSINIYGGNVYVNSNGDGLDSNGNLNLEGGNIIVWGQEAGHDNSPLDCDGTCYINGATVFAAGGNQMNDGYPTNGSQSYITSKNTGFYANSIINVTDASNNVVFSSKTPKYVNWILYSSPNTTSSYNITSGTSSVCTVTFDANGHGTAPSSQTVSYGGFVTRPNDLTADGYTFTGWYADKECSTSYDYSSKVTSSFTLYGGWNLVQEDDDTDTDTETEVATDTSTDHTDDTDEEGFEVKFSVENTKINVYYTQDYTKADAENVTVAYSRNSESGKEDRSGDGQVNFAVIPQDGYKVTKVSAEGSYKNLKTPEEIGTDNIYRLTKITGEVTVTVTTEKIEKTSDISTDTTTDTEDNGYKVTFNAENAYVNVYYTQDYTKSDEENVTEAYSRNSETGAKDSTGNGQVSFSVEPHEGYKLTKISADGSFKNLKTPEDLGTENIYRLTKITGEVTVTVITEKIEETSDTLTDTAKDTEDKGYKVTFDAENVSVNVYYTQDYTKADEENVTEAYSRNSETGAKDSTGNGQVSFSVEPHEGYKLTKISADGNFKNLKTPENLGTVNIYRLTKITGEVTVTILAEAVVDNTDTELNTDTTTQTDTEPNTDTTTQTDTESNTDTTTQTDTEPNTDTTTQTDTESNTDTTIQTDTEPNTDTTTQTDTEPSTDTTTQTDTEPNTDTTTQTDTEPNTDTTTQTDTEPNTDTTTQTDTEPNTDTTTQTDTETDTQKNTDDTPKRMYGDINGDGKITAQDSLILQRYTISLAKLDDNALAAADVNNDGKITGADCLVILRYTIKMKNTGRTGEYIL